MRLNQYIAQSSLLSRRRADEAITEHRIKVNGTLAQLGQTVEITDVVTLDNAILTLPTSHIYLAFHKPIGVVVSRHPQGNDHSIYEFLPAQFRNVNPVGRLDKDSSGLMLLSTDGGYIYATSHPTAGKVKIYDISLDHPLTKADQARFKEPIMLNDGPSNVTLIRSNRNGVTVGIIEGRNRQLRRTFNTLGYEVVRLHRTQIGLIQLGNLAAGSWREYSEPPLV